MDTNEPYWIVILFVVGNIIDFYLLKYVLKNKIQDPILLSILLNSVLIAVISFLILEDIVLVVTTIGISATVLFLLLFLLETNFPIKGHDIRSLITRGKYLFASEREKTKKDYGRLNIHFALEPTISIDDFLENFEAIKSIQFIYSVFSILLLGSARSYTALGSFLKSSVDKSSLDNSSIQEFMTWENIDPVRIISIRYGSPAAIDLLGIGKVLELIRETLKDIAWRGEHEKEIALLERKEKQKDIQMSPYETEKQALELIARKLEIEKMSIEIAADKIDLIERVRNLKIPEVEKDVLIKSIVPKLVTLSNNPIFPKPQGKIKPVVVRDSKKN